MYPFMSQHCWLCSVFIASKVNFIRSKLVFTCVNLSDLLCTLRYYVCCRYTEHVFSLWKNRVEEKRVKWKGRVLRAQILSIGIIWLDTVPTQIIYQPSVAMRSQNCERWLSRTVWENLERGEIVNVARRSYFCPLIRFKRLIKPHSDVCNWSLSQ